MRDVPYMIEFILKFKSLLKLEQTNNYISTEIDRILYLIKNLDIEQAKHDLLKFRALYKDLEILKQNRSKYLRRFFKRLHRCDLDTYYGFRFEIQIAAKLVEMNINFEMPKKRPDFIIDFKNQNIKIECSSRHLNNVKSKSDIRKGFKTVITKKSEYDFVDNNTALFMDSSNLSFNNPDLFSIDHESTVKFLQTELNHTGFGNLTTFDWILNTEDERYESVYNRIDNKNISSVLSEFLDMIWSKGHYKLGKCASPKIG